MEKKISTKYAYARAVKNRLCRIEDELSQVFVNARKMNEIDKRIIMTARLDIDGCVESLEKLLKLL
jgi:hypothetical protein